MGLGYALVTSTHYVLDFGLRMKRKFLFFNWRQRLVTLFLFGLIFSLAALASPTTAQSPDGLLGRIQEFFRQQLGRDYVLLRWTYELRSWPDASLGCPEPGKSYTAGEVSGYVWTLTIDDNKVYELRSTLDASVIVLCTPLDRTVSVNYRRYQSGGFLVDYPETWQIAPNTDGTVILFTPDGTDNCTKPGMKVSLRQGIGNADTMLNDALREAGLVQNMGLRTPVGAGTGQTILYQAACETAVRQYRTSAFPITVGGSGYLVEQWAPVVEFEGWAANYLQILESFQPIGGDNTSALPEGTPEDLLFGYPLAHVFVSDVYLGSFADSPGFALTIGSNQVRWGLKFSADGLYLAFIDRDADAAAKLKTSMGQIRPSVVANNLVQGMPPAWSPQGATVAYLTYPENENLREGALQLTVQTSAPNGDNGQVLGVLPFEHNCSAPENPYIVEQLYYDETGIEGNGLVFEWLPDGRFLYSPRCDGQGLAVWNPADQTAEVLGENLRRAALSADRTQVAALDANERVVIFNLTTGENAIVPLPETPDQLVWAFDGTRLLYTTRVAGEVVVVDNPELQRSAERLLTHFPYTSELNTVSIHELSIATGISRMIWQGQGYAIGRVLPAPNNGGLIFSLIPSDRNYIQRFIEGVDFTELRLYQPETQIYWLLPSGGDPRLMLISAQPVLAPVVPTPQS